ncbi:MAG: glycosyltransferase [Proteobacteria bacterium]|nr:glycosyltransferase [Pseudomonadota bacterium]
MLLENGTNISDLSSDRFLETKRQVLALVNSAIAKRNSAQDVSGGAALVDQACECLRNENFQEALEFTLKAEMLCSNLKDLEYVKALCYYSLGDKFKAAQSLFYELQDFPDNAPARELLRDLAEELNPDAEIDLSDFQKISDLSNLSQDGSRKLRVGMVTPWQVRCGIAYYAQNIVLNNQDPNIDYFVLARDDKDLLVEDAPNVFRCWDDIAHKKDHLDKILVLAKELKLDVVNFQCTFAFFYPWKLSDLIKSLRKIGVRVVLTFHSTADACVSEQDVTIRQFACIKNDVSLVITYKKEDFENLANVFGRDKIWLTNLPIKTFKKIPERILHSLKAELGLIENTVLATHGFMVPNKGIEVVLEVLGLLKQRKPLTNDFKFISATSKYNIPVITEQALTLCRNAIEKYGTENDFSLIDDYLQQEEIYTLLSMCDLLLFPYTASAETASGAVRRAIQTAKPIITTSLALFRDISRFSHTTSGVDVESLYLEVVRSFSNEHLHYAGLFYRANYLTLNSIDIINKQLNVMYQRISNEELKNIVNVQKANDPRLEVNREPKITIITPCKNNVKHIRRCVEAVLSQGYKNFEHIVVDGASTDGTIEILKEYPHLKWISEENAGVAEALNKALKMITGDVVCHLDVENVFFENNVFKSVCDEYSLNPDCDVFYGKCLVVNEGGEVVAFRTPLMPITLVGLMKWFTNINLSKPAMFYSAKVLKDIGPFKEDLSSSVDYEYWLRIAARGYQFKYIDKVLAQDASGTVNVQGVDGVEKEHAGWQDIAVKFQEYLSKPERTNYWRDFYLYRLRNSANYKATVFLADKEEALLGMVLALLELNDIESAKIVGNQLLNLFPNNPDIYWAISELSYRCGNREQVQEALKRGRDLYRIQN